MKPLTKNILKNLAWLVLAALVATCIYYAEKDGKQMKYKTPKEIKP